ncbi:MAG TPA: dicarboxylate transporter/tellurite-resistance protein TehA [Myxococcales bacterium]|jgi:tellurite resistance protein|nr:dicarboxylate transporter/tellurite-resistance protein TehA [Myxococcales bacterium]
MRNVPASFFGMPLGLLALGIAWQLSATIWGTPRSIGEVLVYSGAGLWAMLFCSYIGKWIFQRAAAETEFAHPVQCCFVGLGGVVGLLASIGIGPRSHALALALFFIGASWTLAFALYRTGGLWTGGRSPEATTPILYLPTVAGSLVAASAATALGHAEWGQLAFGAGFFSWLAIESVLLHRLYTSPAMQPALRPALGIQLAPPAVAAVAYLNVGGGAPDLVAHALIGYAILQALILIRMLPWLREAGASPAWWGFSFGAAALPTAAMKLVARGDTGPAASLAPWLFAAGNLAIATIALMTVRLLLQGKLMPGTVTKAAARLA